MCRERDKDPSSPSSTPPPVPIPIPAVDALSSPLAHGDAGLHPRQVRALRTALRAVVRPPAGSLNTRRHHSHLFQRKTVD